MEPAQRETILQVKRKRNETFDELIILERQAKCAKKGTGGLIESLNALNLNKPVPQQMVFRYITSTDKVGQNFMSNQDQIRECLKKKREEHKTELKNIFTRETKKPRSQTHTPPSTPAVSKIRTLPTSRESFRVLELTQTKSAKVGLELPVVRRKTQIIDDNDWVTHFYHLDHEMSDASSVQPQQSAERIPVDSFDFFYDDLEEPDDPKDDDDSPSSIDYPDDEVSTDNSGLDAHSESYGPEDSYSD